MAKEKFDFEAYLKWCEEKHLEASESAVLEQYKAELIKVAQTGEKAVKIAKQKEVFDAIAKYLGREVKYNEKHYDGVEEVLNAMCLAMAMCDLVDDVDKSLDKVIEDFELGKGEKNND